MDTLWTVLITSFDCRVYDFVRGEMGSFREMSMSLKVSAALTFCCFCIYHKYFINVVVLLLCMFLLAMGV